MAALPLQLHLEGRRCTVVGAGRVGTRRALQLAEAGAQVVVVDPRPSEAARAGADDGALELRAVAAEAATAGDLVAGSFLVCICTDIPALNAAVATAAREQGALVARADDAGDSDILWPARADVGPLRIAVSTGGDAPALSGWAAERLSGAVEGVLGADAETLDRLADLLADVRRERRSRIAGEPSEADRPPDWRSAIDGTMLDLISRGRLAEAKERLQTCRSSS